MIIGIGTDIVQIDRIESTLDSYDEKFEKRVFTEHEITASKRFKDEIPHAKASFFAKRFAAKEAFVKALGVGFRDGISMHEVGVENDEKGKPYFVLTGKAKEALDSLGDDEQDARVHLSLSDDYPVAQAFVVIEV